MGWDQEDEEEAWQRREDDTGCEIEVEKVVAFTEKAILVTVGGEDEWVPRSQIEESFTESDLLALKRSKEKTTITIPGWLARDKCWD
jgi:hypothetical protein